MIMESPQYCHRNDEFGGWKIDFDFDRLEEESLVQLPPKLVKQSLFGLTQSNITMYGELR